MFKKINDIDARMFLLTQIFLWIGSFSFVFFSSFCENARNPSDCGYYEFIIAFFGAIIVNVVLNTIIQSTRYKKLEQGKAINKITAYIEIISAPIIAGFYYLIFYIALSFQEQPTINTLIYSITIFIILLLDGIRRLKK